MFNRSPGTDLEGPNGIYYMRMSARLLAPFFSVTVYQPARRGAWRLRTPPFDYRNAQHSGALMPRDGEWYSRSWINLEGDLSLMCPTSDPDLPTLITARSRLSWWPVHATVTWLGGGEGFQKLPARPPEEKRIEWISAEYDDAVFDQDTRNRFPRAFTAPTPRPPKPLGTATQAPPDKSDPPITDKGKQGKEGERSHSSADTESEYSNDWREGSWWHGDWYPQDWSQASQWKPNDWNVTESRADVPLETPRPKRDETAPPSFVTDSPDNSPAQQPPQSSVAESQIAEADFTPTSPFTDPPGNSSIRVEQVTVSTRTQSIEVARPSEDTGRTMLGLQRLAITGPPLTREDRLARQTLANRLALSPELYNLLVFGEVAQDTETPALVSGTATCALPPVPTGPQSLLGDG